MSRDYKVYLEDILEAAARINNYTSGLSKDQFKADDKTLDAVIRNLEVIGEAAKKVPKGVRKKAPEVDWKRIAGLRDILIHEYFGVPIRKSSGISFKTSSPLWRVRSSSSCAIREDSLRHRQSKPQAG
jgi:uncharacterized protein with HEPN domain